MSEHASLIGSLYERHALKWDKARNKSLREKDWLDAFAAQMPAGGSVLDIGCGSGEPIARYFVDNGYRVTGIDSSVSMIEICEARFPGHEWRRTDMQDLDLNRRFEGILAWDSFFHLDHAGQRAMFPIFAAHAAPGAVLMFSSGPSEDEAIGDLFGDPLYHASLDPDEYRSLLRANGFDGEGHLDPSESSGRRLIWIAMRRAR